MKKIMLIIISLLMSALYVYGQDVVVKEVTGRVEYRIPGGRWSPVEKGLKIPVSATISTGFQSRAVLESPRSTIVVQPLSRLTIDELQSRESGSKTSLSLRTGRISAVVKKNDTEPTRFQVRSPIATAAVRGTEFTFNGYQLNVENGLVAFSSDGGRVITVPYGSSSEMMEDGIPMDVLESILQKISVSVDPTTFGDTVISLLHDSGLISVDDLIVTVK